jgi:hypothetical protein
VKNSKGIRLLTLALIAGAIVSAAFGQDLGAGLRLTVPFEFTAAGKTLPAGEYVFRHSLGSSLITVENAKATVVAKLMIVTSLARSSDGDDHLLAFDKIGDKKILSEVWLQGRQGALVNSQQGEHEHEIIRLVGANRGKK